MEVIMKPITLLCFVLSLIASNAVQARGGYYGNHYGGNWGGGHYNRGSYGYGGYYSGIGIGLGLGYGLGYGSGGYYDNRYYTPYYGYPSTIVTVPATPPVYIQQAAPIDQQYPAGYWYYCNNPQGYYPYIKQCPNGWQQVSPTPQTPR
jgi:hypothetical protein